MYTDADRARLGYATLAADMSDTLAAAVTAADSEADLIEIAMRVREQAARLAELAVVNARQLGATWQEIATSAGVSRQTAHERYAPAWTAWRDALAARDASSLPPGAADPSAAETALDRWSADRGLAAEVSQTLSMSPALADRDNTERGATQSYESWDSLVPGVPHTPRDMVVQYAGEYVDDFDVDAAAEEYLAALNAALSGDSVHLADGGHVYGPARTPTEDVRQALADAVDAVDLAQILQRHDRTTE